jgi:hypothetical protein
VSVDVLSDSALFELADIASAAGLAERLARRWDVAVSCELGDTVAVSVELEPGPEDVALLLREVEAWLREESLFAVRFELDGRAYVLEAGEAVWSIDAAETVEDEVELRRARLLRALRSIDRAMAAPRITGLEDLRSEVMLALRLEAESS